MTRQTYFSRAFSKRKVIRLKPAVKQTKLRKAKSHRRFKISKKVKIPSPLSETSTNQNLSTRPLRGDKLIETDNYQ